MEGSLTVLFPFRSKSPLLSTSTSSVESPGGDHTFHLFLGPHANHVSLAANEPLTPSAQAFRLRALQLRSAMHHVPSYACPEPVTRSPPSPPRRSAELLGLILGPPGSKVNVGVRRGTNPQIINVTVVRGRIQK